MEFAYTEQQSALREEVRGFIAEQMDAALIEELSIDTNQRRRGPLTREVYRKLAERNWMAISWPREWGGQDGSRIDQYIVEEELVRAGLPLSRGGGGVPAIAAHGTAEQKSEYVAAAINDDIFFALGFTEPDAGADLAGLKTRAVRDGDVYVINGSKLYTSAAHYATHIYTMVPPTPMPSAIRVCRS
jgi:alkylation response protein AidB-like acyl-CoA dehydrogenase